MELVIKHIRCRDKQLHSFRRQWLYIYEELVHAVDGNSRGPNHSQMQYILGEKKEYIFKENES